MILITGAAGFIGSHLSESLLLQNNKVVGVDNINDYYSTKIKGKNLEILKKYPDFTFYKADIKEGEKLRQIFETHRISSVIHLAARVGIRPSLSIPEEYVGDNIAGTLNLLELSKDYNIKNFIFGSSSSVYGGNKKIPFSETDDVNNQISPYGFTKKSCELLCRTYHNLHNINITCLRFFTVYGSRGRPDMAVYKFTKAIMEGTPIEIFGDGTSRRDYTYIKDIVNGIIISLEKNLKFEIINLGNNNPIILKDLISIMENKIGKKAELKFAGKQKGDMEVTFADINKAKNLLGWCPKIDIQEGISRFVDWYKGNYD